MNDTSVEPAVPAQLRVRGLRKAFAQGGRRIEAVRGVDFEALRGDFIAIMGPSGSGKSTLLHLIAGLTRPYAGSIEIEGHEITGLRDYRLTQLRRRRIGVVFQAYNLIPTLTAEQNIMLPLALDGRLGAGDVDPSGLIETLGLTDRRYHRPDALSGGEQQRVAIARALIMNPAIILADEPTGNLDTGTTDAICRQLKELCRQQGRTLILVTHEPSVAFNADSMRVMKDGRLGEAVPVCAMADVAELAGRYQSIITGWHAGEADL